MAHLKLSKGYSQYGADMGRRTIPAEDRTASIRFHLQRVYLDSGGYDSGGAYWGQGTPLYQYAANQTVEFYGAEAQIVGYLRAGSRLAAKGQIRVEYPAAWFYR